MSGAAAFLERRWPSVLLVASLLLNGFLIGMFAVDYMKPHRGGFSADRFARFELRRLDDRLPQNAVDQIAARLKPLEPQIDDRLTRVRAIRAELMKLAAAPVPDRAAIDTKLIELRAETTAMQEAAQKATYDALLSLPPEDRAQLAEAPAD
jgi:uncharacterized membrane protein